MELFEYKPTGQIKNKHLLTLRDYTREEIFEILHAAEKLKAMQYAGEPHSHLQDKTVALIFSKSSTRTRVSFEQGIRQMGGHPMFLSSTDIQLGRGETIHDTAKVLARYFIDGIMIRTFKQSDVEELAKYGGIPVINGLTDDFHPCQALADIFTVYEVFKCFSGIKLAYFGDGNNVAVSLMLACAKVGIEVFICSPKGHEPNPLLTAEAAKHGKVTITDDAEFAAKGSHVLYTDVFFSMGQEKDAQKLRSLMPYQVNRKLMELADKKAVFMHCLPAHRGEEVTEDVIDSHQSVIFDQAENRLHVQKAVMSLLMGNTKK